MAPKDDSQQPTVSQRLSSSPGANEVEQEMTNTDNKEQSWNQLLARLLQRLLARTRSPQARRRVLMGVGTTVLALLGYRYRRRLLTPARSLWQRPDYHSAAQAPLSLLYQALERDEIQRAWIGSRGIFYLVNDTWKQSVLPSNSLALQQDLLETLSKTCRHVSVLPESLASQAATPLLAALPFVYLAFLYRMMKNMSDKDTKLSTTDATGSERTTFRDVAGMDPTVLTQVTEVVTYLQDPARYQSVGARPPAGILLHGPPGSGKTLLARAVAGEAAVDAFLACSASDFCEMYVGRGAARVRSLFAQARKQAKRRAAITSWYSWLLPSVFSTSRPARKASAILFIDELDALAKTRSAGINSNDEREQTLNQLLTAMDGFDQDESVTLIVMAASNRADVLDPAILRRFDRQVYVGYPNAAGREAIFQVHARRVQCDTESIDWSRVAAMSDSFSGADVRNAVNEAALLAVRERCSTVQQNHLERATRRIRQMKNSLDTVGIR